MSILRDQFNKQVILGQPMTQLDIHEVRAEYVRINVLAAVKELMEAMDEVGWKPWGKSQHFNTQKFIEELADVQMFLDNLKLTLVADGWTVEEIDKLFAKELRGKIRNTLDRHHSDTYDGFDKEKS